MALQADTSLEIERLRQQIAEEARKVSALHDILEAVSTPADLPVILKKALRAALAAARGDAGFIHLRDRTGKTMRLAAHHGIPGPVVEALSAVPSGDGLVAWVSRNREPLLIPNILEDDRTVYLAAIKELMAYVGSPISRGQRVWGTLSVLGNEPDRFGEEEVALLVAVGEEIGIVVENARLRRQAERLLLIQERNRLARDLHDSVTQSLYSVTLFAEAGRRTSLEEDNEDTAEYFSQIGSAGQQALKEMRLLIHNLRPSILAKEGLVRAVQNRLNSVEGRAGIKSQLLVEGKAKLSPALEEALFQIAQEALNNALKHAMAAEVIVRLNLKDSEEVVLSIEDNGRGFDPATVSDSGGMGLSNIQDRAESFGGWKSIHSAPGRGCVVEAHLKYSGVAPEGRADLEAEDFL